MDNCINKRECLNADNVYKCFKCCNNEYFKSLSDKKRKDNKQKYIKQSNVKDMSSDSKESWKDLEATVASGFNAIPTRIEYESKRQVRSGAVWFMPGDVMDNVMLTECKERSTVTAKGEHTISIQRGWLTKITEEAGNDKYPALVFRYKNDSNVYFVQQFEILQDMVTEIKYLRNDNSVLSNKFQVLHDITNDIDIKEIDNILCDKNISISNILLLNKLKRILTEV